MSQTVNVTSRPAGLGTHCDAWHRNPDPGGPYLVRCRRTARRRLVIVDSREAYTVKRCDECAGRLQEKAANGATFEILSDEPIGALV
jgi:hypothetical protein